MVWIKVIHMNAIDLNKNILLDRNKELGIKYLIVVVVCIKI